MKLNKKLKLIIYAIFPILIGILFSYFIFANFSNNKNEKNISSNNEYELTINPEIKGENTDIEKQKYFYINKDYKQNLKLSSEAYIVGDLNTGEIILAKNEDKQLPIASVSKLMTAIVADEISKNKDVAKVSSKALSTYGQNGNFRKGEQIKTKDLIYPLLLQSSNDAAEILAEHWGRDFFLEKMNLLAKDLKMENTSYNDPSGLSSKNVSTVADLFKLTGYINKNKSNIFEITKKRSYTIKNHSWFSTNQFLHKKEYIGGKSGYTDLAKQTVISVFNLPLGKDISRPIGIALLGSKDRVKDVEAILKYLNKNVYYGGEADATSNWILDKLNINIKDPNFITFSFLGDIMLDRGVRSSINKNFNGDYSVLFNKLEFLNDSDIVFANLEGPASDLGKDIKNLYSFRMDPSIIPALKGGGISIVSVANNHAGDWGKEAFIDTLSRLKENEINYTGGGMNIGEAESPTIIEKYETKIGFLGFSDVGPEFMKAGENISGILLANNPRYSEIIKNASSKVDFLVVSIHFGDEYKTIHNKRQEELAHRAIDAGAKIVIGHHPHVTQDVEIYKNGYIVYSLGNFIFDQKFSQNTMEGMLLQLKLWKNGDLTLSKDKVKLNNVFQPDKIIEGKEENIEFSKIKEN